MTTHTRHTPNSTVQAEETLSAVQKSAESKTAADMQSNTDMHPNADKQSNVAMQSNTVNQSKKSRGRKTGQTKSVTCMVKRASQRFSFISEKLAPKPRATKLSHKAVERRALIVGILVNALQVGGGVIVVVLTGLQAMFLDTAFTFISVVSGMVAVYLSVRSVRTTERFPNGMFALEPIYAICKAIFTLSLLVFSLLDVTRVAYEYFVHGRGERMTLGPVVIYEVIVVLVCFGLWAYYRRENRGIGEASSMLRAEASSTLVDGMISGGIGAVAIFLMFLPDGTPLDFLHYTGDFFITTAIVLFAVKEPFEVLRDAFIELVGGVHQDDAINAFVMSHALDHLPQDTELEKVLVFKQGMNYRVDAYLAGIGESITVADMVKCKRSFEKSLKKRLHLVDVNFVFD